MYLIRVILIVFCLNCSNGIKDAESPADGKYLETDLASGQVIVRKRLTQSEALHYCETRGNGGGRLAVLPDIDNAKELVKAIHTISQKWTNDKDAAQRTHEFGMSRRYWIGLVDLVSEGEWVWQKEGTVLQYDFWYPGQPDHLKKSDKAGAPPRTPEHCATLWNPIFYENETHTFNDEVCTNKHYFICDAPAIAQKGRSLSGWNQDDDSTENSNDKASEDSASGGTTNAPAPQQMGRSFSSKSRVENLNNDTNDNASEEYPGIVVEDPNQHRTPMQMGRSFSGNSRNFPAPEDSNNDTNDNSTEDIHFGGTADEHKSFSGTFEGEDTNNKTNEILEEEFPLVIMDEPIMNPQNNSTDDENEIGDSSKSRAPNEGVNVTVNPSMGRSMSSTSSGNRDQKDPENRETPVQERHSGNSSTSDKDNGTSTGKGPETPPPQMMGRSFHSIPRSNNGTSHRNNQSLRNLKHRKISKHSGPKRTRVPPPPPPVPQKSQAKTPVKSEKQSGDAVQALITPQIKGMKAFHLDKLL